MGGGRRLVKHSHTQLVIKVADREDFSRVIFLALCYWVSFLFCVRPCLLVLLSPGVCILVATLRPGLCVASSTVRPRFQSNKSKQSWRWLINYASLLVAAKCSHRIALLVSSSNST